MIVQTLMFFYARGTLRTAFQCEDVSRVYVYQNVCKRFNIKKYLLFTVTSKEKIFFYVFS